MRELTLSEMFVRDLDQIPLPPRADWIGRAATTVGPRRIRLSPAFATALVALLVAAVLVGLQAPAVQHVLDQVRRGSERSDPNTLPALRLALRQMIDVELTSPGLPVLLDGATRRIEQLLRDRNAPASFSAPARSGSFDDDVSRYASSLLALSARSGIPVGDLQDAALQGLAAFDVECGSLYFSNAQTDAQRRSALFAGTIGISFDQSARLGFAHEITVVRPGSPAESAGLRVGDVIRSVDGRAPAHAGELASLLRGNPGSLVTLEIARAGTRIDVRIERAALAAPGIATRLIDDVGYLDLRANVTAADVRSAIDRLDPDARAWIVDLRIGGWTEADVIEPLLIARFAGTAQYGIAIDRNGRESPLTTDRSVQRLAPRPVVALVNGTTNASALIVAAVLQESGAVALGDHTARCANRFRPVELLATGDLYVRSQYVISGVTRRDFRSGVVPDPIVRQTGGPGDAILDAAVARLRAQLR